MRKLLAIFACFCWTIPALFASEMTTNEIYALMRAALHPTIRARLATLDADYFASLPALTTTSNPSNPSNLILDWIIHVSLPNVTNETTYFDSYKTPISTSSLNLNLLTNRSSRLSYIPPIPQLSVLYDDEAWDRRTRPEPGVDYPGVDEEVDKSDSHNLRLTLRAPVEKRMFKIVASLDSKAWRNVEFRSVFLSGCAYPSGMCDMKTNPASALTRVRTDYAPKYKTPNRIAVFAREKGGPWGPPAFVQMESDPLCAHHYANGQIEYIDYGTFRDWYKLDEQNRILGFTRYDALTPSASKGESSTVHLHLFSQPKSPALFSSRGDDYSNFGEKILETYPDDKPKTTRKVRYAVENGKLTYTVSDVDIHYKNGPFQYRPNNW